MKLNQALLLTQAQFLLGATIRGGGGGGRDVAGRFGMSLVCVPSDEIQSLNKRYRGKDEPTDVLSFPYHEVVTTTTILICSSPFQNLSPGQLPLIKDVDDYNLGDVILGLPYIEEYCVVNKIKLSEHLPVRKRGRGRNDYINCRC